MSKEVTLPSGAKVVLKDPSTLRVKDRKNVMRSADNAVGGDLTKALALGDALIAMLVESWSFDLIPPSIKLESLDELTMADYDALTDHTKEAQKVLFTQTQENDESAKDTESPFADSND